jgi:hypothetical protein
MPPVSIFIGFYKQKMAVSYSRVVAICPRVHAIFFPKSFACTCDLYFTCTCDPPTNGSDLPELRLTMVEWRYYPFGSLELHHERGDCMFTSEQLGIFWQQNLPNQHLGSGCAPLVIRRGWEIHHRFLMWIIGQKIIHMGNGPLPEVEASSWPDKTRISTNNMDLTGTNWQLWPSKIGWCVCGPNE